MTTRADFIERPASDRPSSELENRLNQAAKVLTEADVAGFVLSGVDAFLTQRHAKARQARAVLGVEAIRGLRDASEALRDAVDGAEGDRDTAGDRLARAMTERPELATHIANGIDVAISNRRLKACTGILIPGLAGALRDKLRAWEAKSTEQCEPAPNKRIARARRRKSEPEPNLGRDLMGVGYDSPEWHAIVERHRPRMEAARLDGEGRLNRAAKALTEPAVANFVLGGIDALLRQRHERPLLGVEAIQASREASAALHDAVDGPEARRATAADRLARALTERPELATYVAKGIDVAIADRHLEERAKIDIPDVAGAIRDELRSWEAKSTGHGGPVQQAEPQVAHTPEAALASLSKGPRRADAMPPSLSSDRGR